MANPRRCIVLRGAPHETAADAGRLTASTTDGATLWVGTEAPGWAEAASRREVRSLLGRTFEAVVIDLHDGLDADLLGQAHGFILRGGALVLRLPSPGVAPAPGPVALAAPPHTAEDVGQRFWRRLEGKVSAPWVEGRDAPPIEASHSPITGTRQQAAVAESLRDLFLAPEPSLATLIADRGRGKSSALGLAIAQLPAKAKTARPVVVTAGERSATREIFRHAGEEGVRFVSTGALLREPGTRPAPRIIVVDEAAQLPVPWLRALVARYPQSTIAFATTARGYEGTGRGFVLRFVDELQKDPRPVERYHLETPIRWDPGDPLEALVFDLLALDAVPTPDLGRQDQAAPGPFVCRALSKDELAEDEATLRDLFGLLVHAHYRTAPSDLHRLLDAPNLRVHGAFLGGRIVGACLVALEGELTEALTEGVWGGSGRLRGHALPETLVSHSGVREAGAMSFVRSVRIATHPDLRRRGVATRLAEHVHRSYQPDFFGTLFGATPGLMAFRQGLGYALVRVGSSRGVRTGEPSTVMLRPATAGAETLLSRLRGALARDLEGALELMAADGDLPLDEDLVDAFRRGLPDPTPMTQAEGAAFVERYATRGATYDSARGALVPWARRHDDALEALEAVDRGAARLIRMRMLEGRGWEAIREATGHPTIPATMRALRRAARALWERVEARAP